MPAEASWCMVQWCIVYRLPANNAFSRQKARSFDGHKKNLWQRACRAPPPSDPFHHLNAKCPVLNQFRLNDDDDEIYSTNPSFLRRNPPFY